MSCKEVARKVRKRKQKEGKEMAKSNEMTFGQKMRKLQQEDIGQAFRFIPTEGLSPEDSQKERDAAEAKILQIRKQVEQLGTLIGDVRKAFDMCVDKRDEGFYGEGFAPKVTRIRAKNAPAGRPPKEKKDELADLDF